MHRGAAMCEAAGAGVKGRSGGRSEGEDLRVLGAFERALRIPHTPAGQLMPLRRRPVLAGG